MVGMWHEAWGMQLVAEENCEQTIGSLVCYFLHDDDGVPNGGNSFGWIRFKLSSNRTLNDFEMWKSFNDHIDNHQLP